MGAASLHIQLVFKKLLRATPTKKIITHSLDDLLVPVIHLGGNIMDVLNPQALESSTLGSDPCGVTY